MSLDPNIILAASQQHPQFQSPVDTFQKALGLRELVNRSQMEDLAARQQQQQYGDQQSLRTLLQGNPNPTADQIYQAAPSATGTAFLNSMNEFKLNQAKLASAQADVAEKGADFLGRGAGLVQKANYDPNVAIQTLSAAKGTPFEQQANGLIQQIQQNPGAVKQIFDGLASQAESLKDQQAAQSAAAQAAARQQQANAATKNADTNASKADRDNKAKDLATVGSLFGNAQNQNDWAMAFAKAKAAGVSSDILNAIPTAFNPATAQTIARQAMTPDQVATLGQGAQRNAISQQEANAATARTNIERQRYGLEQGMAGTAPATTTGDAALQGVSPQTAALIKAIANYQVPPPNRMTGVGAQLMSKVAQYDPSYQASQYGAVNSIQKDFTSGQTAKSINAINTAIGHLGELQDAANSLHNTRFTTVNELSNWMKRGTDNPGIRAYSQSANAVASELSNAYNGHSEGEVERWQKNADPAMGPQSQNASIGTAVGLLAKKIGAIQDQWSKTPLGQRGAFPVLSQDAKATLQKLGYDPNTLKPRAAGGGATVKMQAPDGTVQAVPAELAQHYTELGAKVVQ